MAKTQKKVAILVEDQYQVLEVWYPLYRMREEGIDVVTVGTGAKNIYGSKEGYPIKADKSIKQVKAEDFDCVVIPGGYAPDILRRYNEVVDFVKQIYKNGGIVSSICHGGWLLVSAGIIRDCRVTCFFAIKDDLIAAGGKYVDEEVMVDKNIVTSRKPDDLPKFVSETIKLLNKK